MKGEVVFRIDLGEVIFENVDPILVDLVAESLVEGWRFSFFCEPNYYFVVDDFFAEGFLEFNVL